LYRLQRSLVLVARRGAADRQRRLSLMRASSAAMRKFTSMVTPGWSRQGEKAMRWRHHAGSVDVQVVPQRAPVITVGYVANIGAHFLVNG